MKEDLKNKIIFLKDYVDITVGSRNLEYYRNLGFNCNIGDNIHIKVSDIKPTSHIKIPNECPICHRKKNTEYRSICKQGHTMCNSCATIYFNFKDNRCVFCNKKASKIFEDNYYCSKHFEHMKKYGRCLEVTKCDKNEISYENNYAILHIRSGENEQCDIALVKIDLDAVKYVENIHWSYSKTDGFIVNKNNQKLHRYLYEKLIGEITCNYVLFNNGNMFDMRTDNLIQSDEKSLRLFSDENTDIDGIFVKDNLQVGIIDETHYKLINIRELKDISSNKKPIIVEVDKNGCWNCVSHSKHPDGYVYIHSKNKKIKLHKRVLELKLGRELNVNQDELTRHKCDNPQCCNPDHLEVGNSQDNHDDMVSRGRGYWQTNTGYFKWNERNKKSITKRNLLPKELVISIYQKALSGDYSYRELDKMYNLCRNTSANIANKKTYKYYTDDLTIIDNRLKKNKENYILIRNLQDGGIYTNRDISKLSGVNRETVRNIINGTYYLSDNDVNIEKIVGDGSGVIYYMNIEYETVVDGIGFRNSIYCSKCNIYCKGCHNKESWDIKNGKPITINLLANLLLKNGQNITFTGGECSLQAKAFSKLARILKEHGRTIWMYSGKNFEELQQNKYSAKLLSYIDVLVDGKFQEELRDLTIPFRGSSNQRIIDMNKTRETGELTLWETE